MNNKKKTKSTFKAIAACAVSSVMLLASGCTRGTTGPEIVQGGKIAVIAKQQLSFWDDVRKGAEDAGNEFGFDIIYTVADGDNDYVSQIAAINDAINKKAKAIVIAPNSTTELNESLEKAMENGIKVVTINSDLDSSMSEKVVSTIKSSDTDGGMVAASNAVKAYIEKKNDLSQIGKIAIVGHTANTAEERISGFTSRMTKLIANAKGVEVPEVNPYAAMGGAPQEAGAPQDTEPVTTDISNTPVNLDEITDEQLGQLNDDREKARKEENDRQLEQIKKSFVQSERCAREEEAKEAAKKLLGEDGNGISIIFATNTNATLGVCAAVEELNLSGKIVVVGFNSDEKELAYIRNGTLDGVIVQNPYIMGYVGVRYAKQAISNSNVTHSLDTGVTYVNAGNLNDDFVKLLLYPDQY